MPSPFSLLKWLQYIPMAYDVVKAVAPAQPQESARETQQVLEAFRKSLDDRFTELESENARLRTRLREAESSLTNLQAWIWIGGGSLGILLFLSLVLAIIALAR